MLMWIYRQIYQTKRLKYTSDPIHLLILQQKHLNPTIQIIPPSDETIPDDEVETVPIDPPICESDINTIVWQEQTKHTVSDSDGQRQTCYHTYTYKSKIKSRQYYLIARPYKSGYGLDAEIKTSISYEQTNAQKSYSCSQRLGTHTPSDKPKPY